MTNRNSRRDKHLQVSTRQSPRQCLLSWEGRTVTFCTEINWTPGTTHIVMAPLEFMQRLAALVPRPRLHLIRFHGVLAPNAKLRAMVVPQAPEAATGTSDLAATESGCTHSRPARISWARLLKRVLAAT